MHPWNSHKQHHHLSLHSLVSMSTMVSPTHNRVVPIVQGGGGGAVSQVPPHSPFLSNNIQEHLRDAFDSARGPDPTLSREKLNTFLSNTQGMNVNLPPKNEYKFEEFLEYVWYLNGFAALKEQPNTKMDLTKPISNYFISSSHNTYLSGNQLSSKSTTDAYKNVLTRGCRCIEIDVWNGEVPSPGHRPHLSGTISSQAIAVASAAVKEAKGKYVHAKQIFGSHGHHKMPSISTEEYVFDADEESAIDSTSILETGRKTQSQHGSRHGSRPSSQSGIRAEPRVLHGWTLTADVGFRDVCKTIRETAFLTSNLPVIVSLEVHADLEQQEVMVEIMQEEWKGLLVDEAHEACDPNVRLPRLEELLNKILIKVKKATPTRNPSTAPPGTLDPKSSSNSLSPARPENGDSGQSGSEDERGTTKKKKNKICDALSRLGIYTHSEHFTNFNQKEASYPPHVFSIGEYQILELHNTAQQEMFAHNRDFFMRAYPSGRRIDSSNPDPSTFWRKGVQMVALNWQSWDEGTMLNEAMFADSQGWVLKPPAYRSHDPNSPNPPLPVRRVTLDLKVTIFAGQRVPLPPSHGISETFYPYVKCELHVDRADGGQAAEGKYKLATKYKKTDAPDFGRDGTVLSFVGVQGVVEDLSFLRWKVEDDNFGKDKLAAWACIRLDRLSQGYRFVKLFDAKGVLTDGMLLVKIEKSTKV